jgi:hypothetical protein
MTLLFGVMNWRGHGFRKGYLFPQHFTGISRCFTVFTQAIRNSA